MILLRSIFIFFHKIGLSFTVRIFFTSFDFPFENSQMLAYNKV